MGNNISGKLLEYVHILDRAAIEKKEIVRFTANDPGMTVAQGYEIQKELFKQYESRGEKLVGYKMGLTSKAKMKQMGVTDPIVGRLSDRMLLKSGAAYSLRSGIHPKIEPEIAFEMGSDLSGPVTRDEAQKAVAWVFAAMEVIDSRYLNFEFQLPDVVADNCSSHAFVVGQVKKRPQELDLGNLGMVMSVNGKPSQMASSSAILGHPLDSLCELSKMLGEWGTGLKKGQIVLAGGATAAILLEAETEVTLEVQDLGITSVSVQT